jgi:hypothetical protein
MNSKYLASDLLPNRDFQFWDFTPSHSMLLLRSPRNLLHTFNVDIIFENVNEVLLTQSLKKIYKISRVGKEEYDNLNQSLYGLSVKPIKDDLYRLICENNTCYIQARNYWIIVNELDIFESSIKKIDMDWFEYISVSL